MAASARALVLVALLAVPGGVALVAASEGDGDQDPQGDGPGGAVGAAWVADAVDRPVRDKETMGAGGDGAAASTGGGTRSASMPSDLSALDPRPRFPPPRAAPGSKELEFVCASPADGSFESITASMHVIYTCPIRIYDNTIGGNAGWLFGNIRLVVDDVDPARSAFLTLHGSPTEDGRNDYSRSGLTHSAFTTRSMGLDWTDSWTSSGPGDNAYGEWATGAFDERGNLYIGYLWTTGLGHHAHTFRIYKMPGVDSANEYMERYTQAYFDINARDVEGVIDEPQLVYIPPPDAAPTNQTGPMEPGEVGNDTLDRAGDGTIVATWRETAANVSTSPTGMSAWIDMGWTHTGPGNGDKDWAFLRDRQLIGPCRDASDPVVWDRKVYIACVVDRGYDARGRAKVGEVDIWSFDPDTNKTSWVANTMVSGDHPRLAATEDGYFAIATTRLLKEQQVEVYVNYGWHGKQWQAPVNVGPILHTAMGDHPMNDAHVTAIQVTRDTKTAFLVYKEWNDVDESQAPDPADPTNLRLTDYRKFVFSGNQCTPVIAGAEIVLGTSPDLYQQEAFTQRPGVFNDQQDGLDAVRMPNGEELVFFSISDYGAAQFGAIRGSSGTDDQPCNVGFPAPVTPIPIAPAAATVTNPYSTTVGAAVGLVAVSMVTYLLAARRRVANSLATQAK